MSVRLRLTIWYVALLLLCLLAAVASVALETERAAYASLDTTLSRDAYRVAASLTLSPAIHLGPGVPDSLALQTPFASLWIRVLDARGRVAILRGLPAPWLASREIATAAPGPASEISIPGPGEDRALRIFVLPVALRGTRVGTIQMIADLQQLNAIRNQLLHTMGVAILPILLVTLLGGLFLADRALRPVDRIALLAGQIGASDLHRRIGAELRGRRQRARPRDELERLADTFDAMLARLEEASLRQRQLTADAAHELCTPIATIASNAEITLSRTRSAREYQEAVGHMLEESRHMARLVDDLLLLARADGGRLPLQRELVEIDEVCRQAARALAPLAAARQVSLHSVPAACAVLVLGDELHLSQVVRNLVDNAIRHTPPGGTVAIRVAEDAGGTAAPGTVRVWVSDTGPGVPPEERERIFERFHRLTASTPSSDPGDRGSGLGLAICKAIVVAHGGQIRADEGDGGGALFVVTMPPLRAAADQ